MSADRARVSAGDAALLAAVERTGSVVAAAGTLGMSRDRAVYRLRRLAAAFGRPLVTAERGGARHGRTRLTPLGAAVARAGFGTVELRGGRPEFAPPAANLFRGTYRVGPPPTVALGPGEPTFTVAFAEADGERVGLLLEPEAVLLAPRPFRSSARNVLAGTVLGPIPRARAGRLELAVRVGRRTVVRVEVTDPARRDLGLAAGARAYLFVKATALRPVL